MPIANDALSKAIGTEIDEALHADEEQPAGFLLDR
eukprot:SAG11_NODE_28724_length_318_cov_1.420091_1_plen_34_part_01